MQSKRFGTTIGQKLSMLGTLGLRDGISREDFLDVQSWVKDFKGEPEKACIIEFDEKQAERIHILYSEFFRV